MLERRNSDRLGMGKMPVKETNGDYFFSYMAWNLSEEGIYLLNRLCTPSQEPFSKLTFTLPNGTHLRNLTARIIREERKGAHKGCAFEFLNLSEDHRMSLKKFFVEHLIRGTG